jgi:hypothetical protein
MAKQFAQSGGGPAEQGFDAPRRQADAEPGDLLWAHLLVEVEPQHIPVAGRFFTGGGDLIQGGGEAAALLALSQAMLGVGRTRRQPVRLFAARAGWPHAPRPAVIDGDGPRHLRQERLQRAAPEVAQGRPVARQEPGPDLLLQVVDVVARPGLAKRPVQREVVTAAQDFPGFRVARGARGNQRAFGKRHVQHGAQQTSARGRRQAAAARLESCPLKPARWNPLKPAVPRSGAVKNVSQPRLAGVQLDMTETICLPSPRTSARVILCAVLAALTGCGGSALSSNGKPDIATSRLATTPGTLVGDNLTRPAGAVWLGTHLWFSDNLEFFLRLDPTAPGGLFEPNQSFRATGIADGLDASGPTATHLFKAGQPSFDAANGFVYVPDFNSRTAGVWRLTWNAANERVLTQGSILAPGLGLAGLRPTSTALGPDGDLYVGSLNTSDVKRVTTPAGATQTVQSIGKASGRRIFGMAFVGNNLYLAEANGLSVIRDAPSCRAGCSATPVTGVAKVETSGIATDGADNIWFIQAPDVMQFNPSTGSVAVFANQGTLPPGYTPLTSTFTDAVSGCVDSTCTFSFSAGQPNLLALDGDGSVIAGEDPGILSTPNALPFCGRIWRF